MIVPAFKDSDFNKNLVIEENEEFNTILNTYSYYLCACGIISEKKYYINIKEILKLKIHNLGNCKIWFKNGIYLITRESKKEISKKITLSTLLENI